MYIYGDLPHWLYIQIQHVLLFCSLPAIEVFEQLTCLGCGQLPDEDMPQKPWPWSWMPARSRKAKGPRACKAFGQTLGDGHGERFPVVFYDCVLFVSKVFVRYLQGTALIKSLIKRGLVLACALYLFSFSWLTPPEPRDLGVTFRTETITISNHQGWILGYIYIIYILAIGQRALVVKQQSGPGPVASCPSVPGFLWRIVCITSMRERTDGGMPRLVAEEAVKGWRDGIPSGRLKLCGASWSHELSLSTIQWMKCECCFPVNFPKKNSDNCWAPAGFASRVLKDFERVLNWLWQCSAVETQVSTFADMCGIVNPCQSAFRGLGFPQYPYAPYLPTLRHFMGWMFANIPYIRWSIWGMKQRWPQLCWGFPKHPEAHSWWGRWTNFDTTQYSYD
jgi:hypothetical protein